MNRLIHKTLAWLPRRRRRMWRYVSPRRRGAGLLLLALLIVSAWGYWSLTNNDRVRSEARRYLRGLCGGRVEIAEGRFNLLEGIELSDVRIYVPGPASPEPFLRAKKVILRYGPWRLLATGRLQPTEVVCLEPVVTLEHDVRTDRYNFEAFFAAHGGAGLRGGGGTINSLPIIRVRQGLLRWVDTDDKLRMPFDPLPISLVMSPGGEGEYIITVEEQRSGQEAAISGKFALDVRTGSFRIHQGAVPIPNLDKVLPGKYRQWRQRYNVTGEVRLKSPQALTSPDGRMECQLVGVSLKMPPEEGGMNFTGVDGTVCFDPNGVELRDVSGQAIGAGGARFEVTGRYEGYEPDRPFDLKFKAWAMTVPSGRGVGGQLGGMLKAFEESFEVSGRMNLEARIRRLADGKTVVDAQLTPLGMSVCYKAVPYRIDDLRGLVVLTTDHVELRQVVAGRQGAVFTIDGQVGLGGTGGTDVSIRASEVVLDTQLRDALPERARKIWDQNSPSGKISGWARIQCGEGYKVTHYEAVLDADGNISASRQEFPYRVENLMGRIRISDGEVFVEQLSGSRGPMRCVVNGTSRKADTSQPDSDITMEIRHLPLDEALLAALPDQSRRLVGSLHASGQADSALVTLKQVAGGDTYYDIRATMSKTCLKPDAFPYELADASGVVEILPESVEIKNFSGRHGDSSIVVNGWAWPGETVGVDLNVRGQSLALDEALREALPDRARDIWRQINPSGAADMEVHLVHNAPRQPAATDYLLAVHPKNARLRYEGFPYSFSGVNGTVTAAPSRIDIEDLRASQGAMQAGLSGSIITELGARQVDLRLWAREVPINQELLSAMPSEMSALTGRFSPGGTCDVDLSRLTLFRIEQPASQPAMSGQAASQPVEAFAPSWSAEGKVRFKEAELNLDFGRRTASGTVSGGAGRDAAGLRLNAAIDLSELMLGRRRLTDVQGKLVKSATGTIIRIDDLSAKVHGGRATGFAEIRLSDPPQYGLRLSVEDVLLADLFQEGPPRPKEEPEVTGLLTGNLEMTATAGRPDSRQATGLFRITKGQIYKLPVVMGFVHVIYLWVPGGAAFTEGEVAYRIQGQKLIFDEISLRGPAMSVVGSGTMDMDSEALRLTFLTGPPGKLPRIAAIESLLKGLAHEIAEVSVTGTLSKPVPRAISLPGLEEAVRRLVNPGQD